jgi:trehalose/maltose hydrolase-like predicted phosphorylase
MAMQHPKTWNGNAIAMQDRNGRNETIIETIALQLQCDRNAIAMRSQCDQKPQKPFQCDRSAIAHRKPLKRSQTAKTISSQRDRSAIAVQPKTARNQTVIFFRVCISYFLLS